MDNITHSIVGFALGEAAVQKRVRTVGGSAESLRGAYWAVSLLANNFPDLDIIISFLSRAKIDYLLHHRGHTHTFAAALPQAAIILLLAWIFAFLFRRRISISKTDWWMLAALAFGGLFVHVGLDSLNSYGVHPFWPWDNRWFYGDAVFILEPALWLAFLPALAFTWRTRVLRWSLWGLFFLILLLIWWPNPQFCPRPVQIMLSMWAVLCLLSKFLEPHRRMWFPFAAAAIFVASFAAVSWGVREETRRVVGAVTQEKAKVRDVVLTPFPGNLFCWSILTVETEADHYRVRLATHATFPQVLPVEDCPEAMRPSPANVPLVPASAPNSPAWLWGGNFEAPLTEVQQVYENNCVNKKFFQFSRAPYWSKGVNGEMQVGDVRYDRRRGPSFAQVSPELDCGRYPAPWVPPLADLLRL